MRNQLALNRTSGLLDRFYADPIPWGIVFDLGHLFFIDLLIQMGLMFLNPTHITRLNTHGAYCQTNS